MIFWKVRGVEGWLTTGAIAAFLITGAVFTLGMTGVVVMRRTTGPFFELSILGVAVESGRTVRTPGFGVSVFATTGVRWINGCVSVSFGRVSPDASGLRVTSGTNGGGDGRRSGPSALSTSGGSFVAIGNGGMMRGATGRGGVLTQKGADGGMSQSRGGGRNPTGGGGSGGGRRTKSGANGPNTGGGAVNPTGTTSTMSTASSQ